VIQNLKAVDMESELSGINQLTHEQGSPLLVDDYDHHDGFKEEIKLPIRSAQTF
jgi:hypothetical protein